MITDKDRLNFLIKNQITLRQNEDDSWYCVINNDPQFFGGANHMLSNSRQPRQAIDKLMKAKAKYANNDSKAKRSSSPIQS